MEDIIKIVAGYIRKYRLEKGYTQEKLAEKSGLHESYIGKLESGRQTCSLVTLAKLANALDVPPQALLGKITQEQIYELQNKPLKEILNGSKSERDFIFTTAKVLLKKRKKKKEL